MGSVVKQRLTTKEEEMMTIVHKYLTKCLFMFYAVDCSMVQIIVSFRRPI